jgi:hypothetical protein
MIYSRGRFLFLHIPRTGGISLTNCFASCFPSSGARGVLISTGHFPYVLRRHARADELSQHLVDWDRIPKFAVIRNPWRAIESNYRRMRSFRLDLPSLGPVDDGWAATFRSAVNEANEMPFCDWVLHFYSFMVEGAGHWWHYCLADDGADLGVEAFRFESLSREWPTIAERMGIPGAVLPHCNAVESAECRWTTDAMRFVRAHFADDFRRFGYPENPRLS